MTKIQLKQIIREVISEGKSKNYTIIYFKDKKPIKKYYDSVIDAFDDYEHQGCIYVELFKKFGIKLASYPHTNTKLVDKWSNYVKQHYKHTPYKLK